MISSNDKFLRSCDCENVYCVEVNTTSFQESKNAMREISSWSGIVMLRLSQPLILPLCVCLYVYLHAWFLIEGPVLGVNRPELDLWVCNLFMTITSKFHGFIFWNRTGKYVRI